MQLMDFSAVHISRVVRNLVWSEVLVLVKIFYVINFLCLCYDRCGATAGCSTLDRVRRLIQIALVVVSRFRNCFASVMSVVASLHVQVGILIVILL